MIVVTVRIDPGGLSSRASRAAENLTLIGRGWRTAGPAFSVRLSRPRVGFSRFARRSSSDSSACGLGGIVSSRRRSASRRWAT